ncbi:MAG: ribosome maturation factor RimP [Candidatus Omnitrophica bacterium]|nr:ribosome maturation factor RimP [Candidatus Omnitrophota bacterium]
MVGPSPFEEETLGKIRALVEPLLASRHVDLVEMTYRREGPQNVLRLLVDTAQGITVGQCTDLNQSVGALLEEYEVISDSYLLEVASPGLDRKLKTPRDFERIIGRRVRIQTREPVEGKFEIVGSVASVGDELVTVLLDHGEKIRVPFAAMTSARQDISFK